MIVSVSSKDSGLSLIELIMALAVFALVAVMGLQALNGSLRMRDGLGDHFEASADLARPLAMLRQDLSAIVPARFQPPGQNFTQSALSASPDGTRLEMSLGGQIGLSRSGQIQPDALHRVIWRYDATSGALFRQSWPVLTPTNDTAIGPERIVMEGLTGIEVRSYWPRIGWQQGVTVLDAGPSSLDKDGASVMQIGTEEMPLAISVTLQLASGGSVPILQALR